MKILMLYSSREGQTKKIMHFIAERLVGSQCDVQDIQDFIGDELSSYDKVLIGASIRYGRLSPQLYSFIEKHQSYLQQNKCAFYCVNLTARKEEQAKDTPEGSVYIKTFLKKSPWQPLLIGVFAGALYYPRYRWFDRMMIRFIMKLTGGETDTSKEIEYTNWNKVAKFAIKFAEL